MSPYGILLRYHSKGLGKFRGYHSPNNMSLRIPMKKKQRWPTAADNKVDLDIVNSNLCPPEIFKHEQTPTF